MTHQTPHKPAILNDLTHQELIELRAKALDARTRETATCRWCGAGFEKNRKWQEFCSITHQKAWHANWRDLAIEQLERRLAASEREVAELRGELAKMRGQNDPDSVVS